jgi:chromosome segregation ATPase
MAARTTPQTSRTERSYADYLEDVGGGSEDDDLKRVDTSGSSDLSLLVPAATSATPHGHRNGHNTSNSNGNSHSHRDIASPQPTEPRSFVNGLLSPFSPLLKQKDQREEYLKYLSLQPCRKVSVVVRILPCDENDAQLQRCVFPHIKGSKNNPVIRKPKAPRNMVVVNPSAFGKFIPSQVTMDTARLVAQVAHISSEDWARLYEFHHVMWPSQSQDEDPQPDVDEFSTIDSLSRAVTQDALVEHQSSLLISLGQGNTCMGSEDGVWPRVISHCQAWMEEKAVCTLTMYEILDEKDSFRDLLNRKNKDISLRHVDMKGAVLNGLTQVPIDSMSALLESLLKRKKSNNTVIGTLNIWTNAVSFELKKSPNSQITCVELAAALGPNEKRPGETIVHRHSTMCLGQALRQLVLHSSFGTEPAISFRDTSLTKVLQRSLESSKIVLLASVSQLSNDYESTLATLNYLRRLLVKPGQTASSPFKSNSFDDQLQPDDDGDNDVSPGQLAQYADDRYLLEKIISDPRQRLAKVFKKSPPQRADMPILQTVPSEDDYQPVDYMEDWEGQAQLRRDPPKVWESPPARQTLSPKPSPQVSRGDHTRFRREPEPENDRNDRSHLADRDRSPQTSTKGERPEISPQPRMKRGSSRRSTPPPTSPEMKSQDTVPEAEVEWEQVQQARIEYVEPYQEASLDRYPGVREKEEPVNHQNPVNPAETHRNHPLDLGIEKSEVEQPHPYTQDNESPQLERLDRQDWIEDEQDETLESLNQETDNRLGIPEDLREPIIENAESDRSMNNENQLELEEWGPENYPTVDTNTCPRELASNLEYSDTEYAPPEDQSEDEGEEWYPADRSDPSQVSDASNLVYDQENGEEEDEEENMRYALQAEDSWEQKVNGSNQIKWIPEVSDENESTRCLDQMPEASQVGDLDWPNEKQTQENDRVESPVEGEQNAPLNHHRNISPPLADIEEEICFVEDSDPCDSPTPEQPTVCDGEKGETTVPFISENEHILPNSISENNPDRNPTTRETWQDRSGLASKSPPADDLNSSHWTDWGTDHSDGDELDLEPQTEYELPESPRPAPDGTEEEDWYASPLRLNEMHPPQARATTPRSSNREIHKRTSIGGRGEMSRYSSTKVHRRHEVINKTTRFVSESASVRSENKASNHSAFSSVSPGTSGGFKTTKLPKSVDSAMHGKAPDLHSEPSRREVRSNLFPSTSTGTTDDGEPSGSDGDNMSHHGETTHFFAVGENTRPSSKLNSSNRGDYNQQNDESFEGNISAGATKEIETLESFVGQIQDVHQGLWKSSALSLHRLKESLQSQGGELELLLLERESLRSEIGEVRDESIIVAEEYEVRVQRLEKGVHELQNKLNKALVDKSDVEKIAEEAISAQDTLERRVNSLHEELNASRMRTEFTRAELEEHTKDKDDLRQRLQETMSERDKLEVVSQEESRKRGNLDLSVRRLGDERIRYQKTTTVDKATIENLRVRLRQREAEIEGLEGGKVRLERLRLEDKTHLEGLTAQSREFGMSLESTRKERSRLEEDKRNDRNLIAELQDELRSVKNLFENLENEHSKCHEHRVEKEAQLSAIHTEFRETRARFDSLQVEHDNIVESRREQMVESNHMQMEIRRLKSTIVDYEEEGSRLKENRREDQATIHRLESDLRVAGTKSDELHRLQKEMSGLKQENVDIETLMAKRKTEYFDKHREREEEVAHFKELSESLERELTDTEHRARMQSAESESERNQLTSRLAEYETELDLCIRQRDDFASRLESTEETNLSITIDLEKKERELESYREDMHRVESDIASLRDRENSRAAAAERELERIKTTRSELEIKISEMRQQRDDARNDFHKETLAKQSLFNELEIAKEKMTRQHNGVEDISQELHRARAEKSLDDERIFSMESALHRFRSETKEKLDKLVRDHQGSKQLCERERRRNETLQENIQVLQMALEKVKRERDACAKSLEVGRERLAMMTNKSVVSIQSIGELDIDEDNTYSKPATLGVDFASRAATSQQLPELYLTDFSTDQFASLRAEEIVAYLAMSAKSSLQETQDEASHLRSQVYRLEEEKESEVASLKTKIRHLERQLSNGDVMKGRSGSLRSRYEF